MSDRERIILITLVLAIMIVGVASVAIWQNQRMDIVRQTQAAHNQALLDTVDATRRAARNP